MQSLELYFIFNIGCCTLYRMYLYYLNKMYIIINQLSFFYVIDWSVICFLLKAAVFFETDYFWKNTIKTNINYFKFYVLFVRIKYKCFYANLKYFRLLIYITAIFLNYFRNTVNNFLVNFFVFCTQINYWMFQIIFEIEYFLQIWINTYRKKLGSHQNLDLSTAQNLKNHSYLKQ